MQGGRAAKLSEKQEQEAQRQKQNIVQDIFHLILS